MKKSKRILSWIFSGLLFTYFFVILFPQFLFINKLEYNSFIVYYNNREINQQELKQVLDKSEKLLKGSELFNEKIKQKLVICDGYGKFTLFATFSRKAFAVNYPLTQNIFLSKSSISDNRITRNAKENNVRTLSGVIAHETVHSLLENKLGLIKYKLLPSWKNEGYCDFISKESSYDQQKGLYEICNDHENSDSPSYKYFKYRLFTEFLFEDEHLTLDEFLNGDFEFTKLNEKLKKKYIKN